MTQRIFSKNLWNEAKNKFEAGVIEISGEKIAAIEFGKPEALKAKKKIHDFGDLFIGPSAIDLHVHSRDFEESHKETFETSEAAAQKGGVSTLVCMANTRPRIDSPERVQEFLRATAKSSLRFIPFACVTKNLEGKLPTDWNALLKMPIAGLSDDGKPILDERIFEGALSATKKTKKILSLHEEDTCISKASLMHLSETSVRLGIEGSPEDAEARMVERDLAIAVKLKAPIHFGHISSAKSVAAIRKAKRAGLLVSAELTPHHGLLSVDRAEEIPLQKLSTFKVCPPIRSAEDRAALRKAVSDGSLDCFASDHAPHSHFEKNLTIDQAAHGMIALEYFFSLYNELRLQAGWSWKIFYNGLFYRPASLLSMCEKIGRFAPGYEASLTIFDPSLALNLHWSLSRSRNTPFEGQKVRGTVFQHWVRGRKVYDAIHHS